MENIVYHGSREDLEEIKAHKSTHQKNCIYATPEKVVSLLFMGKGHGDLDTMIASIDGELVLVERRPNVFSEIYNKPGYLYELDGSTFSHYDYLWSREVISFESSINPINKTYYPSIMEALNDEERKGNLVIYRYPNRPKEVPIDNSDLIDKYIHFEESGLTGAVDDLLEIYPEFRSVVEEKMGKARR